MSSVLAAEKGRTALASLAPLFAWPDDAFETRIAEAAECIDAHAAQSLRHFAQQMSDLPRAQQEITYTATFDLAPSCSPYLGVQLFGEDSQHRARLMYGIQSVIATRYSVAPPPSAASRAGAGAPPYRELPDHIAVVLALLPYFKDDEWPDLVTLVLEPALAKMEKSLDDSRNPYRHLVRATRLATRAASREGGVS